MDSFGVSIIICCYNSARRLPDTLRYLANQKLTENIPWEVIVVNNASDDNTTMVALQEWEVYSTKRVLHVVDEAKSGQGYARITGFRESKYDIVIFCDDDNWLDSYYIKNAVDLLTKYPRAGVLGGEGVPYFESETDIAWFNKYQGIYAVGEQANEEGIVSSTRGFVFGAGSVWRRELLEKLYSKPLILSGRKRLSLSSADDIELCYKAILEGFEIVYSPKIKYTHFLPSTRLNNEYINRFKEDSSSNAFHLHGLLYKTKIQEKMFDSKIKRTWWGQLILVFRSYLLKKDVSGKLLFLLSRELILLNRRYDRSFK